MEAEQAEQAERAVIKRGTIFVALKSSVVGGVHYDRQDEGAASSDGTRQVRTWRTVQTVDDPAERKEAMALRSLLVSRVWARCVHTEYGLLCSPARRSALEEAVAAARAAADKFNDGARSTRLSLRVLLSEVLLEEGGGALLEEATETQERLDAALEAGDVEETRKVAKSLAGIAALMAPKLEADILQRVAAAREAAKAKAAADRGDAPRPQKAPLSPEEAAAKEAKAAERERRRLARAAAGDVKKKTLEERAAEVEAKKAAAAERAAKSAAKAAKAKAVAEKTAALAKRAEEKAEATAAKAAKKAAEKAEKAEKAKKAAK